MRGWRHFTKRSPFLTCSIAWPSESNVRVRANHWACALRNCAYPFPALVAQRIELRRVAHPADHPDQRLSATTRWHTQANPHHACVAGPPAGSQSHLSHRPAAKGWFLVAGR